MKPLSLTIQNFLSFEKAKIKLDNTGLVSVQGENLDGNGASSNGSGKSSLFIAIRWCLYGETDKKMPSDEVINSSAGKNCMVETHWIDEATGIEYLVSRYRKDTKHKNKLRLQIKHPGLDWVDKTLGKNDLTQQSVNQVLGMDDTVFMASCFASQENPVDIPAMKDSELKKLLEDSLPIAKFDPLHKKYKDHLDKLKSEYDSLEKKRTNREYSIGVNEKQLVDIANDQTKWRTDIDTVRASCATKIRSLQKQLEELGDIQSVTAVKDVRAALQSKYRSLGVDALPLLETRLEGLKSRLTGMKGEANKCPTCGSSWQDKSHKERFDNTYASIEESIVECQGKIDRISENIEVSKRIETHLENIDVKIVKMNEKNLIISATKRELDVELVNLKRLSADDPFKSSVERISSELVEYKRNLVELNEAIEALKPDIALYTNMVDATSPKGFRYHLLESVTPELNAATNKYLAMLSDGKISAHWSTVTKLGSGEYRESFSIKVNHNGRTNFGSLSSGQKRKVRLACWFALQDMIANRASKEIKLWVCDEVDHALDSAGIERLMSLLEEKAKDKKTVLVISHNNLKDWISNSITVTMKDDISTVSGFLNVS